MTHVGQIDFTGVTRKNLSDDMRKQLRIWTEGVAYEDSPPDAKSGLWLFGPRRAGTSYVARVVVGDLAYHHSQTDAMQVKALGLVDEIRGAWTIAGQMRANSDDMGLWWETRMAEDSLDVYFNRLQVLWIDNLHHDTIDWPIWKKHVQPRIENRVEEGRIVIVSTTMVPDDPGLPKGVIKDLFTPILCDGYRPDGAG